MDCPELDFVAIGLMSSVQRSAFLHLKSYFQDKGRKMGTREFLLKRIHSMLPDLTFMALCGYDDW